VEGRGRREAGTRGAATTGSSPMGGKMSTTKNILKKLLYCE